MNKEEEIEVDDPNQLRIDDQAEELGNKNPSGNENIH